MTIAESYKSAINRAFLYSVFRGREHNIILKTLSAKAHGSATMSVIPPIQDFKLEKIDDTHDKVTFGFDDYHFDGVATWKPCKNNTSYVFMGIA